MPGTEVGDAVLINGERVGTVTKVWDDNYAFQLEGLPGLYTASMLDFLNGVNVGVAHADD